MKIVIVGTAYPLRGGIAHYIALLYEHLSQRHQVRIITFKRQYPRLFFPGRSQLEVGEVGTLVPTESLLDSINPVSWVRVAMRILQHQAELVIFKYWMPFFAPAFATISFLVRLFSPAKSLVICDNITPHEKRPGDDFLNRLFLSYTDFYIVQSETVRRDLLALKPRAKFKEVPHPVYSIFPQRYSQEEARKILGLGPKIPVLLFFGYVRKYKGLHYLLQAIPEVMQKLPQVHLLVVGEFYEPVAPYQELIEHLGIKAHVTLVDQYIPNEEIGLYFAAADVVVLPYVSATQSGIVQIAYNFNKPVITTDVGGLPEVVKDGVTGFVVPAQNYQALAQAIINYFEQSKEQEFVKNMQHQKEQYSWERLVTAIEEFMKKVG